MLRNISILLALLAALVVLAACSDRNYGALYCPPGPRDTMVVYARLDFQQVEVWEDTTGSANQGPGMAGLETLYLGSDDETRSSILANFDFSQRDYDHYPDSLFTLENIRSVELSLVKYRPYFAYEDSNNYKAETGAPIDLYYQVQELQGLFDPNDYKFWPGPDPETKDTILNSDFDQSDDSNNPYLALHPEDLMEWFQEGNVSLAVSLSEESDPGLVGFASRESQAFHDLPYLQYGTIPAPSLLIQFNEYLYGYQNLDLPPAQDTSTFERMPTNNPAEALVQTGLISLPFFTYEMPDLPEGSCLDRIMFRFYSVSLDSFWYEEGMRLSLARLEMSHIDLSSNRVLQSDVDQAASFFLRTTPDTLAPSYIPSGYGHYDPYAGQYAVVYPWPERLDLMMGYEPPQSFRNQDLYYSRSTFHGPSAPEDLRPVLLVITGAKGDD